jgi:hypothetical protein
MINCKASAVSCGRSSHELPSGQDRQRCAKVDPTPNSTTSLPVMQAAGVVVQAPKRGGMTKRPEEIALMAESGRLLAQVFGHLDRLNLVGMSTMQVNDLVDDLIVREPMLARPAKGNTDTPTRSMPHPTTWFATASHPLRTSCRTGTS